MIDSRSLTVTEADAGERIDKFLAKYIPEISRSKAQWLLEHQHVILNNTHISASSAKLKAGDIISIELPQAPVVDMFAVTMDLDIIYEDADLLVINKPAGMPVHPAAGHYDDTLVNGLLAHCGDDLSAIGGEARPGIVHRLDKDTTGLMLVAKHDQAHRILADQLANRSVWRLYHALVWGVPVPAHGIIDAPLARSPHNRQKMAVIDNGKAARTHYQVLQSLQKGAVSWVACKLETGRTHQIRIHMTHIGHALLGDPTYGNNRAKRFERISPDASIATRAMKRQALHAAELGFIHPTSNQAMHFTCPWPADMQHLGHALGLQNSDIQPNIDRTGGMGNSAN